VNSSAKGDSFVLSVKKAALAKRLDVLKVRASGHMGDRGGIPADIVVNGWKCECKRYSRGIGSSVIEDILTGPQGVHAVIHRMDRGISLVTMGLEDWLDLLAALGKRNG
jgi:hypothetical protein